MDNTRICKHCGQEFEPELETSGRVSRKQRCATCSPLFRNGKKSIGGITKGELFAKRKNWQSARSSIRRDAERKIINASIPLVCKECGYDKHVEISHIKSVSSFSDESVVDEINSIDNLVLLCPNHHWEFDNGVLVIGR